MPSAFPGASFQPPIPKQHQPLASPLLCSLSEPPSGECRECARRLRSRHSGVGVTATSQPPTLPLCHPVSPTLPFSHASSLPTAFLRPAPCGQYRRQVIF